MTIVEGCSFGGQDELVAASGMNTNSLELLLLPTMSAFRSSCTICHLAVSTMHPLIWVLHLQLRLKASLFAIVQQERYVSMSHCDLISRARRHWAPKSMTYL